MPRPRRLVLLLAVLTVTASCRREAPTGSSPGVTQGLTRPGRGLAEVDPDALPRLTVERSVYVPVYSSVYVQDAAHPFNLAVTLSARNTDRTRPLYLKSVEYHDADGRLVRNYVTRPVRVPPLASAQFFVRETDASGGSSASFLVDWAAEGPLSEPIVEAVMVGTAMNQGVSFTSQGRAVDVPPR